MKKAKLTLTLNKETVANLNSNEMNGVKGGTDKKCNCGTWTFVASSCNPACAIPTGGGNTCLQTCNGCMSDGTACC